MDIQRRVAAVCANFTCRIPMNLREPCWDAATVARARIVRARGLRGATSSGAGQATRGQLRSRLGTLSLAIDGHPSNGRPANSSARGSLPRGHRILADMNRRAPQAMSNRGAPAKAPILSRDRPSSSSERETFPFGRLARRSLAASHSVGSIARQNGLDLAGVVVWQPTSTEDTVCNGCHSFPLCLRRPQPSHGDACDGRTGYTRHARVRALTEIIQSRVTCVTQAPAGAKMPCCDPHRPAHHPTSLCR
jgi:hypothetical protein